MTGLKDWYKNWAKVNRKEIMKRVDRLILGKSTMVQVYEMRTEIGEYFDELAYELEKENERREETLAELEKTQKELARYKRSNN